MRINNNVMAFNANRNLGLSSTALGKNLEKLSSGYRINRAGDDAAGLVGEETLRLRLGHDLGQVAVGVLHDLLERLHERVGDGESGEALLAAVRALVGVAACDDGQLG